MYKDVDKIINHFINFQEDSFSSRYKYKYLRKFF